MNASAHFRTYFTLAFLLMLGSALGAHAITPPTAPQRAQQATTNLVYTLGLNAGQAARMQVPVLRLVQERDTLAQQSFTSAAEASAAHTVVEYHFFTAVALILTPNQFDDLVLLSDPIIDSPESQMAAR